ncbi:hypothetical protein G7Y89_g2666 [Cudoniella acicularis]|uniref:DUF962 domain-containing protein n=1 Tax=Cudoniella acicularis TaxID=354080 RepID=A0A8H4RVW4_9HELO|nr:hypothetical protein G7Y89_g2666 [Cudoniella acicularis]
MSLDLEKQLCFYGAYHHNPVNIAIHMTCVPLILAASLLLATNSPTFIPLPSWLSIPNLPLNAGTIGAIGLLDMECFEGRAPALLDNLIQALVLAPFFVFMEFLFKFGYRPELQKRVNEAVGKEIKKFKTGKTNGTVKNGKAN